MGQPTPPKQWSVDDLTRFLQRMFDSHLELQRLVVMGEISNYKKTAAGHVYFDLKDKRSKLAAVMFAGQLRRCKVPPQNGMVVRALGRVSIYEPAGNYQLTIDALVPVENEGQLMRRFLFLRDKLRAEGLFETERKRPLPLFPRTVGLVTSDRGAAVADMIRTLTTRYPPARIVLAPALVQGDDAPDSLRDALDRLVRLKSVDVIVIGRGGGSFEDLNGFNDEKLARAIAACPIPVVSAVGHEQDFTICDFVADQRATTPTGAAHLVVPDVAELQRRLDDLQRRMAASLQRRVRRLRQALDEKRGRWPLAEPERLLQAFRQNVDTARERLPSLMLQTLERRRLRLHGVHAALLSHHPRQVLRRRREQLLERVRRLTGAVSTPLKLRSMRLHALDARLRLCTPNLTPTQERLRRVEMALAIAMERRLGAWKSSLASRTALLQALSPEAVLARGYALCLDTDSGKVVSSVHDVQAGGSVAVRLHDGSFEADVTKVVADPL